MDIPDSIKNKINDVYSALILKINTLIETHNTSDSAHTDLFNSKANVDHSSTQTTYGIGSSTKYGHTKAGGNPQPIGKTLSAGTDNGIYARENHVHTVAYSNISGTPDIPEGSSEATDIQMDGTRAAGSSEKFARANHVHPTDTSRAAASHTHIKNEITDFSHTHGNLQNDGKVGTSDNASKNVVTDANGKITTESKYSHPTYTARTGKPTENQTPSFGGTVTVSQITSNETGHVTGATDKTITIPSTTASSSSNGLMTSTDKSKLDGIAEGANKYVHPSYTARTGKPTGNQTPDFGGTATVSQITSDASGHVTSSTDRTIKIPDTVVSTSSNGLMSSTDKTKLDGISTGATKVSYTQTGTGTIEIGKINIDDNEIVIKQRDNNTTYTAASASPKMDGTATVGTSAKYAREDHIHPTDTSRASTAVTDDLQTQINNITTGVTPTDHNHDSQYIKTGTGTVTTTNIANGTIKNEDISSSAAIDQNKINNLTNDLAAKNVTLTKLSTPTNNTYISTYEVKQGGTSLGKIDIPKDYLVKSGSVKTVTTANNPVSGYAVGDKYIDFVINTKDSSGTDEHIYINVKDLVDVYTHPNSGVTAGTNYNGSQTPAFGANFNIPKLTFNAQGHITASANSTVKIPNTLGNGTTAGLSTNDYTTTEKTKLSGIATGATKNTVENSLTSTSTTNALSAAQGKELKTAIDGKSTVSYTQTGTGTVEIGKINIDGTEIAIKQRDNNTTYTKAANTPPADTTNGTVGTVNKYALEDHSHPKSDLYAEASHTHTKSQITDFPTSMTPTSHAHGSLTNGGTLNSDITSVNKVAVTDSSNNLKTISKVPFANLNISKANITGLGIPAQDTTYSAATQSANGLMSSTDKKKLDGIATGANVYTHPSTHPTTIITESNALNNLETAANATQQTINSNIDKKFGTIIPNGTESAHNDLNKYNKPGFYYQSGNANTTYIDNLPNDTRRAFTLLVEYQTGTYGVKQTLTFYNTSDPQTFIRIGAYNATATSGWGAWKQIAWASDSRFTNTRTPTDGSVTNAKVASNAAIDFSKLNITKDDITGLGIPASDTNTTYGADRGISNVSGKFGHSNTTITAQTTSALKKIKYDTYGHITGTDSVSSSDLPTGSTSQAGVVKLNTSTSSTSTTEAATPSAVKSAYDLANGKPSLGTTASTAAKGNHGHGNITTDGKLGSASDFVITDSSKNITTSNRIGNMNTDGKIMHTVAGVAVAQKNDILITDSNGIIDAVDKIGNITYEGKIGTAANKPIITGSNGVLQAGSFGTASNTFCEGNDSRLSDARTPTSHTHGNITNAGAIGSAANKPIITTTSGKLTTGSFGTTANTFCEGNDSRLSDARTPLAHTHKGWSQKSSSNNWRLYVNSDLGMAFFRYDAGVPGGLSNNATYDILTSGATVTNSPLHGTSFTTENPYLSAWITGEGYVQVWTSDKSKLSKLVFSGFYLTAA